MLLEVGVVGLPRDGLHDESEHIVVGAAILVATAYRSVEGDRGETAHKLLQGHRELVRLAGGGGLGLALYNAVQLGFYDRAATLVAVVFVLVSMTDALADRLRRKPAVQREPESGLALVAEAG